MVGFLVVVGFGVVGLGVVGFTVVVWVMVTVTGPPPGVVLLVGLVVTLVVGFVVGGSGSSSVEVLGGLTIVTVTPPLST